MACKCSCDIGVRKTIQLSDKLLKDIVVTMLELDHITVIAPSLEEGVAHVQECLGLTVPFGQRHPYMGTHNHLLQLGKSLYLEVVAIDPDGINPNRKRWFGLDDQAKVRADWDAGLRLRGWVARTKEIEKVLHRHRETFGEKVPLPADEPLFLFSIPDDGSLPLNGAAPSIIDRFGKPRSMENTLDLGARLKSFTLEHPEPEQIKALYQRLGMTGGPDLVQSDSLRYRAQIDTPHGTRTLT